MQNKTLIIVIGLVVVLGLVGYFFFQKSRSGLTPQFQLPQPSQPSQPLREFEPLLEKTTPTPPEESRAETSSQTQSETQPETKTQLESQNVIVYSDSGYSPNTLKVKVGETVTFKNQSSQAMWPASDLHPTHRDYSGTSLSEHCPDTTGTAFDACTGIQPGNSWSFTFNKKGTWKYHDHLNPSHTGTIVVE